MCDLENDQKRWGQAEHIPPEAPLDDVKDMLADEGYQKKDDDEIGGNVLFRTIDRKWESYKGIFLFFSFLGQGCISEESLWRNFSSFR